MLNTSWLTTLRTQTPLVGLIMVLALLIIVLTPIWAGLFFPTQDGPVYLYNAWVFHSLRDPTNVLMHANFSPNIAIYALPNWVMAQLMWVFPPLLAEKLFYSVMVLGWLMSVVWLCRICALKHPIMPFLAATWVFNEFMMLGMINFCLAQIPWLLATCVWLRYRHELLILRLVPVMMFSVLAGLAVLLHPFMALPLGVMLLLSLVDRFIQIGLTQCLNPDDSKELSGQVLWLPWLSHGLVSLAWLLLWICVLLFIVAVYHSAPHPQEAIDIMPSSWVARWTFWLQAHPLGYFSEAHTTLGTLTMWVFMLMAVGRGVAEGLLLWRHAPERLTLTSLSSLLRNPIALVSLTGLVLILIGFFLPWSINNVGFMYKRCFWLAWICLLPITFQTMLSVIDCISTGHWRTVLLGLLVSVSVGYNASAAWQCITLSQEITRVLTLTQTLPAHRRIQVITMDPYTSMRLGALTLISPFYHMDSYVGIQQPDRVPSDTFGRGRYNLVRFNMTRIDDRTLDALVLFRQPRRNKIITSSAFYQPHFTGFDTQLYVKKQYQYRRQPTPLVLSALKHRWSVIMACSPEFVFPSDVVMPPEVMPSFLAHAKKVTLTPSTFERDSGWGWLATSLGVLDANQSTLGVHAHHTQVKTKWPYTQWGRTPAHLYFPLSKGRYRIVWWVYTPRSINMKLSLQANGQPVVTRLRMNPGPLHTVSYRVTVGDEGLLQTISGDDGSPWGMSGMAILPE